MTPVRFGQIAVCNQRFITMGSLRSFNEMFPEPEDRPIKRWIVPTWLLNSKQLTTEFPGGILLTDKDADLYDNYNHTPQGKGNKGDIVKTVIGHALGKPESVLPSDEEIANFLRQQKVYA